MSVKNIVMSAAGATPDKTYIEDVFSTYLYTGNGSSQTITNGIDLAGKGGMVWTKLRGNGSNHLLVDTIRGNTNFISSDTTSSQESYANGITSFLSNGYTLGTDSGGLGFNYSAANPTTTVSWTFRKAPKFFDVVTYTGNGLNNRAISHALGSTPGMIIVKCTSTNGTWAVYHRGMGVNKYMQLEAMNAQQSVDIFTAVSDTTFTLGTAYADSNANGATYVAYLFAHDTSTDGLIQCGSFTTDANGRFSQQNLGWEPQFLLLKCAGTTGPWYMVDSFRGWTNGSSGDSQFYANTSGAESFGGLCDLNSTGFINSSVSFSANTTYIYMAIRRGPMRTPTDGTKVFSPDVYISSGSVVGRPGLSTGADMAFSINRSGATTTVCDRLRGIGFSGTTSTNKVLNFKTVNAETTASPPSSENISGWNNSFYLKNNLINCSIRDTATTWYSFKRAPGFFDEVCYKSPGTGGYTINHNLGVAPELIIVKHRDGTGFYGWAVYHKDLGINSRININLSNAASFQSTYVLSSNPTNSQLILGNSSDIAYTDGTFVAYLFASCPGVSKVGSYTGTGTTNQINCGFTNGARFVLIKRTDSTGNWYLYDTASGIVAGNDNYITINSTSAEVTNTDYIDPYAAGFEISSTAPAEINANGGTFIYLAIA